MRIYLPATLPMLREAVTTGRFEPVGDMAFAVTDGLRDAYPGADVEDLEYLAMHDAALASLRLIAAGDAEPARVVLAAEIHADAAGPQRDDLDRAAIAVRVAVRWSDIAAVHLDGGDAAAVIRAAAEAIDAADLGDLEADLVVGEAEDIDLAWYAPGEIGYLLTELTPP